MKTKTKTKEYCVHIYPRYHEIEDIQADSPEQAELFAMESYNGNNYDDIAEIQVMRVCHCDDDTSTDNDITNKVCDNCGKEL